VTMSILAISLLTALIKPVQEPPIETLPIATVLEGDEIAGDLYVIVPSPEAEDGQTFHFMSSVSQVKARPTLAESVQWMHELGGPRLTVRAVEEPTWQDKANTPALLKTKTPMPPQLALYEASAFADAAEVAGDDFVKVARAEVTIQLRDRPGTDRKKIIRPIIVRTKTPTLLGWHPGDMHCHTEWSDGAPSTIPKLARRAKKADFSWLAPTDHAQMFDRKGSIYGIPWGIRSNRDGSQLDEFQNYIDEVRAVTDVVALPSFEYSSKKRIANSGDGATDSHLLAVGDLRRDSDVLANPMEAAGLVPYDGEYLISQLTNRNMVCSIAHPLSGSYPWFGRASETGKGFNDVLNDDRMIGVELLHTHLGSALNPIQAVQNMLKPKREVLQKVQAELRSGNRLFFTAGSDAHGLSFFGNYYTYVFTGKSTATRADILEGLRKGNTVASSGPLVILTVDGEGPGSVVHLAGSSTITLKVAWVGPSGLIQHAPRSIPVWLSWSNSVVEVPCSRSGEPNRGVVLYEGERKIGVPPGGRGALYAYVEHPLSSAYASPIFLRP
ncbi:MAG TPA: CehA/McbA family metallohydrolase, partial [Fimbriimonadaceae bacterium]|nr:CehA/McbA family metallohydrolase [Fimbriimonadaceae bacterium]